MLRRFLVMLVPVVMLLAVPAAAEAAVVIDPGYQSGDLGLELSLAYLAPGNDWQIDAYWAASDSFAAELILDVTDASFNYGELDLYKALGPVILNGGLYFEEDDLYWRAGLSGLFGEEFGLAGFGEVLYGDEDVLGFLRLGLFWRPAEGAFVMAGIYEHAQYIFDSGLTVTYDPALYFYARVSKDLGKVNLSAIARVITDLDYSLDISAIYQLGRWGGVGAMVSREGDPNSSRWTTGYGVKLDVVL